MLAKLIQTPCPLVEPAVQADRFYLSLRTFKNT